MSTLSLKNINKIYPNNVQAVFDFNLDIKDKEFIVFVGPSGCGKSTTLRMVAGLEEITSGELYIDGQYMNNTAPKNRNIAMVFQSYALYPHMSVYKNMAFSLKLRKMPRPIYEEPNETVLKLREEIKVLLKEIKIVNKQFKKEQDSKDLLVKRAELYSKLYSKQDKIDKELVQKIGKDEYNIKRLTKLDDSIKKEIIKLENAIKNEEALPKKERDENYLNITKNALSEKKNQLKKCNEELDYLNKNNVPLTKVRKLSKYEIDLEVNKAAESIDLIRYLYRKPGELSGGQRQRVALGRAIVRKPKVFLMDEPLSNLDAKLRVQTRSEISKIHKRVGATTIYVTHDQTEAMTMADRIVIMKDGYVQQIGKPDDVYADPDNKFVAGFIGSPAMNFIKGVYKKGTIYFTDYLTKEEVAEGKTALPPVPLKLNSDLAKLLKKYEGKDIYFGARPEDITLVKSSKKATEKTSDSLEVTVDFSELLGYESIMYTYIARQKICFKASSNERAKPGEKVHIAFNFNKIFFFDTDKELRIR